MRPLRIAAVALVIVGVSSITWAQDFSDNFDSYAAGTALHGVGGWKGWDNAPGAGAPVSDKFAFSGKNSVEITGGTDLVHQFTATTGRWVFSTMQYIPAGATGETYFILLNRYQDGGAGNDWSIQLHYNASTGTIIAEQEGGNATAPIVFGRWAELKFVIDLVANTCDWYYDGALIASHLWDGDTHGTIQAVDLYANNASPVYYDDIKLERYYVYKAQKPDPADGATGVLMPLMKWIKGDKAVFHDVYLGTSPELTAADLKAPHLPYELFFYPLPVTPGTTYYWRVDEIMADNTTITTGDVWSFTIAPNTAYNPNPRNGDKWIDPNAPLSWNPGQNAATHELYFGTDQAAVAARDASVFKGALNVTSFEPGTLATNTTYYWAVDEDSGVKYAGEVWSFTTAGGAGGGVKAEYFANMTLTGGPFLTQIEPQIDHSWGDPGGPTPSVVNQFSARWTADLEIAVGDTYTFVTTSDDGARLWLNGKLIVNSWIDQGTTSHASKPQRLEPGIYSLRMEYYENGGGAVAQLLWETATMSRQIIPGGPLQPPVHARAFYPANGDVDVPQNVTLIWNAGDNAVTHDVYFGMDMAAVAAATPADAGVYQGSQARASASFDPGLLEGGKTYYWRVDEVNDAAEGSPWKGSVWGFTTATFLVIDNFEAYTNDSPNRLFQAWVDGMGFSEDEYFPTGNPGNGSGSAVGHDIWSQGTTYNTIAETTIVHGGRQSMPIDFNNLNAPYYGEAVRTWKTAQDWTADGADTLVLYVRGKAGNLAAKAYVALEDSSGKIAVVTYADDTAVTSLNWLEWQIPLSSFTGVKATAVKKMYIGVGDRDKPTKVGAGTLLVDDIKVIKAQ